MDLQQRLAFAIKVTAREIIRTLDNPQVKRIVFLLQIEQLRVLINIAQEEDNIVHDDFIELAFNILKEREKLVSSRIAEERECDLRSILIKLI